MPDIMTKPTKNDDKSIKISHYSIIFLTLG